MKKSVILTATALGAIFTQSTEENGSPKLDKNGLPFGYLRVENPAEVTLAFGHNDGGVKRGQSALVSMTVDAWEKVKKYYKADMEIPGNVRIIESLVQEKGMQPKYAGNPEKGGIACTLGGKQIFRRTEFDPTGSVEDVLIQHDNVIAGSNASQNATATQTTVLNGK